MEKRTVTRFFAICEREYKSAAGAKRHEKVCRCFTNPKYRTCNTCKYNGGVVCDNDGFRSWNYIDCKHPESRDIDFDKIKIPNSVYSSCANCPFWENDTYKGEFEKMTFSAKKLIENKPSCEHEYIAGYTYCQDAYGVANPESFTGYFCKKCGSKKDELPF